MRGDIKTRWKPGQSGNPGGRAGTGLPAEFRQLRAAQRNAFFPLVVALLNLSPEESERRRASPGLTNYEYMILGLIQRGGEGEVGAAKFILELALGKLADVEDLDPDEMKILILVKQYIERVEKEGIKILEKKTEDES